MLCLLLLLCGLASLGGPLKKYVENSGMQITVPEKIRSVKRGSVESEVSYKIVIENTTYIVNLVRKMFLPHDFQVYSYDSAGIMKPFEDYSQNFCYYQGHIEGFPTSLASISTCAGLRLGLLQFETVSYGIEPLKSSIGFEHVIYPVKHDNEKSQYLKKSINVKNVVYKIKSIKSSVRTHYIEMHIIVEKNLYKHMGGNTATVTEKIFQLVGLMNAFFSTLNLTVILASLELWIDENKIPTTGDVNELLHAFQKWKKSYLVLRPHDVYRESPSYIGAIFQGMICNTSYGGGIALHSKTITLDSFGVILVQLLSVSMGIAYDNADLCRCRGAICLMSPEAVFSSGMKMFSNCSVKAFKLFTSSQVSQCLQNQPYLEPVYRSNPVCGNNRVEQGEDCDCGSQEECQDTCCDAATCRLKSTSRCAQGPCCNQCEFKTKGEVCRESTDECDLPEYCNGSSGACQEDLYVINGHRCANEEWICMNGRCLSGKAQCQETFGTEMEMGSVDCFEQLNTKNDITGNCGILSPGNYKACGASNWKCGKLICSYDKSEILRNKEGMTIYANISGHICVSIEYPPGHAKSALMWVRDGTVCGPSEVCRQQQCVSSSYLGYDCTPATCSDHGVCNNKRHCHCNPTYVPPNCETQDSTKPGGSVDSGNLRYEPIPETYFVEGAYHTKSRKWPFFLIIPFFVIFSVLVATVVKVYYQKKKWKTEDYANDENIESESEPKSSKVSSK
uniref:Disintegrin and metalloproteinase domain-containing protein 2 n=1 Tax=Cavia porcellus TaxID=10141 RepID=H0W4L6_CAVPO